MPCCAWHEGKKQQDFRASMHLALAGNFFDWEIITLFYSALHYVDSFLANAFSIEYVRDHKERKNLIMSLLSITEKDYRMLYHLGRDARYTDVPIGKRELAEAKVYFGNIKFRLTPVTCRDCGQQNLVNKGKCEICGKKL